MYHTYILAAMSVNIDTCSAIYKQVPIIATEIRLAVGVVELWLYTFQENIKHDMESDI